MTEPRGYLAIDSISGELLYFVDVDRVNYELTTEEIQIDLVSHYDNIDEFEEWESTDEFDFIQIINDYGGDIPQGRKFWGWSDWENNHPCNNGFVTQTRQHYAFWVKNGDPETRVIPC
ncbi:MAG: hypothetical protein U5L96_06475 [Owenweeksia sp.]|nr:hypothetical protein [Owenweeksia sp.]